MLNIKGTRGDCLTCSKNQHCEVQTIARYLGIEQEHFDRLLSRVIQHEVDHLTGIFFTDYLTPAKHSLIDKRLSEIAETGAPSTGIIL